MCSILDSISGLSFHALVSATRRQIRVRVAVVKIPSLKSPTCLTFIIWGCGGCDPTNSHTDTTHIRSTTTDYWLWEGLTGQHLTDLGERQNQAKTPWVCHWVWVECTLCSSLYFTKQTEMLVACFQHVWNKSYSSSKCGNFKSHWGATWEGLERVTGWIYCNLQLNKQITGVPYRSCRACDQLHCPFPNSSYPHFRAQMLIGLADNTVSLRDNRDFVENLICGG